VLSAEDRTNSRQATDVSLLTELVLEVYLAAWTRTPIEDEHRVGASCDEADDGEADGGGEIHLDRFTPMTWDLERGLNGGATAELWYRSIRARGRATRRSGFMSECRHRLRGRSGWPARAGRTALSACARREYVGSGCYTTDPYLAGQTTNCWNGG